MSNFLFDGIKAVWNGITGQTALTKQMDYNYKLQQYQNDYNTQMWNLQKDFNLDMWNKNNEYNSPSAQVQRLRDAGLHPSLAFGGSAGNTSGPVSVGSPQPAAAIAQTHTANYLQGILGVSSFIKTMTDMINSLRMTDKTLTEKDTKIANYSETARKLAIDNALREMYKNFMTKEDKWSALYAGDDKSVKNRYEAKLLSEFERDLEESISRESGARIESSYNRYALRNLAALNASRYRGSLAKYNRPTIDELLRSAQVTHTVRTNDLLQKQYDNFDILHGPKSAEAALFLLLNKGLKKIGINLFDDDDSKN